MVWQGATTIRNASCRVRQLPMVDPTTVPPKESKIIRLLAGLAWVYLAALAAIAGVMVLAGERWWIGTVLLYVPRLPLLLPLLVCAPLAFRRSRRRVFAIQAAVAI